MIINKSSSSSNKNLKTNIKKDGNIIEKFAYNRLIWFYHKKYADLFKIWIREKVVPISRRS